MTDCPPTTAGTPATERIPLSPKGASGRQFFRVSLENGAPAILCHYNKDRRENALYADIARFLQRINFPVPKIFAHDPVAREILLEDLGDTDLFALRNAPADIRLSAYRSALDALARLHALGYAAYRADPNRPKLMRAFGPALYHWEHEYFFIHYFSRHISTFVLVDLDVELAALIKRLGKHPRQLVHRDCQSQNILWHNSTAYFIDFQGLRVGTGLYDIASLLFDPYVSFTDDQRLALFNHYQNAFNSFSTNPPRFPLPAPCSPSPFPLPLLDAAVQRLLQALGAYCNIGHWGKRPEFLQYVQPAVETLRAITANHPHFQILHSLLLKASSPYS